MSQPFSPSDRDGRGELAALDNALRRPVESVQFQQEISRGLWDELKNNSVTSDANWVKQMLAGQQRQSSSDCLDFNHNDIYRPSEQFSERGQANRPSEAAGRNYTENQERVAQRQPEIVEQGKHPGEHRPANDNGDSEEMGAHPRRRSRFHRNTGVREEETRYDDGTRVRVFHEPFGETITATERPNGQRTLRSERIDGTTSETIFYPDGTVSETTTRPTRPEEVSRSLPPDHWPGPTTMNRTWHPDGSIDSYTERGGQQIGHNHWDRFDLGRPRHSGWISNDGIPQPPPPLT